MTGPCERRLLSAKRNSTGQESAAHAQPNTLEDQGGFGMKRINNLADALYVSVDWLLGRDS